LGLFVAEFFACLVPFGVVAICVLLVKCNETANDVVVMAAKFNEGFFKFSVIAVVRGNNGAVFGAINVEFGIKARAFYLNLVEFCVLNLLYLMLNLE